MSVPPVGLPSLSVPPVGLPSLNVPNPTSIILPPPASISAAPSVLPSLTPRNQIANFENLAGLPLVAVSPIGSYQDLNWNGFSLVKTGGIQNIVIVKPNTPNNLAAFGGILGGGSASISSTGTSIDHFDLNSFYFGCALGTVVSVAGVPASCTITVRGFTDDAGTQLAAQEDFCYTVPTLNLSTGMVLATLPPSFKNLRRVTYTVAGTATAGLIDTVAYTAYNK